MIATYRVEPVIGGIGPSAGLLPTDVEEAKCARCGDVLVPDNHKMSGEGLQCVICKQCNSRGTSLSLLESWTEAIGFFCCVVGMGEHVYASDMSLSHPCIPHIHGEQESFWQKIKEVHGSKAVNKIVDEFKR